MEQNNLTALQLGEAIKKGDADEAERLANLHIMHVMENLHIEFED